MNRRSFIEKLTKAAMAFPSVLPSAKTYRRHWAKVGAVVVPDADPAIVVPGEAERAVQCIAHYVFGKDRNGLTSAVVWDYKGRSYSSLIEAAKAISKERGEYVDPARFETIIHAQKVTEDPLPDSELEGIKINLKFQWIPIGDSESAFMVSDVTGA